MAKSHFSKSLGRELGKNTGRVISNGLFGDKHASKSVHIIQGRLNVQKAKAESELEIENQRIKQENQIVENAQIENISSLTLSSDENELASQLNQIISLIGGQKSRKVQKSGIEKIEYGITQLKSPENKLFFQNRLKKTKLNYNLITYIAALSAGLLLIGFLFSTIHIIFFQNIGGLFMILGGAGLVILFFRYMIKSNDK